MAGYELLTQSLPDWEADIPGGVAAAEASHQRLEQRMRELPDRDPRTEVCVRLSLWMRLQARIAPIDRLLAAREAAEDDEVDDLYKHSTGDPVTDTPARPGEAAPPLARCERHPRERPRVLVVSLHAQGAPGLGHGAPPVLPFIFTDGTTAIVIAAVISLIAHFLVGAAKSLITLRSWFWAGMEMTLAGVVVGGATYLIGLALPT